MEGELYVWLELSSHMNRPICGYRDVNQVKNVVPIQGMVTSGVGLMYG